jgi:hypothetical protein
MPVANKPANHSWRDATSFIAFFAKAQANPKREETRSAATAFLHACRAKITARDTPTIPPMIARFSTLARVFA